MTNVTDSAAHARSDFAEYLAEIEYDPERVNRLTDQIHDELRSESGYITEGNFESIHPSDLEWLFAAYDDLFFEGRLGELARHPGYSMSFRLSPRMTNAGGTTTRTVTRSRRLSRGQRVAHEIAVSTTLLYQTFADVDRPITVTGILCEDRLQALQRIFEHEITHLIELLVWEDSSCAKERFAGIARRLFAHQEMTHQLITPRERAATKYGIRAGDRVRFRHEGLWREGFVNRITKRATILVPDPKGTPYDDGGRYLKYYVPIDQLVKIDASND